MIERKIQSNKIMLLQINTTEWISEDITEPDAFKIFIYEENGGAKIGTEQTNYNHSV